MSSVNRLLIPPCRSPWPVFPSSALRGWGQAVTAHAWLCPALWVLTNTLRKFPCIPVFLNGRWILSNTPSVLIEMMVWFFFFHPLMWWVPLINAEILNRPCTPAINPPWLPWITLFTYCWLLFVNICYGLLCPYSWAILVHRFLFFVWHQYNMSLIRQTGRGLLFILWKWQRRTDVTSLNACWSSWVKPFRSEDLFVGGFKTTNSMSLLAIRLFKQSISYWARWASCASQEVFLCLQFSV